MRNLRTWAAALAIGAAAALAGCETPVELPRFPELTYAHLGRLHVNAAAVEVVSEYTAPLERPFINHLVPTAPEKALKRWAQDRLEAAGRQGVARLIVKDARITETPLKVESGIAGAFKKEQSVRFEAQVEALLEITDERGFRKAFAAARTSRTKTLREDATLNDRDRATFELVEALMKDFNAEMERNIKQYLGAYLF